MNVADLLISVRCGRPGCGRTARLAAGHLEFIARECGVLIANVDGTNDLSRMVELGGWSFGVSPGGCLYGICGEDATAAEAAYQATAAKA
jgi:hypothetical protein